MKLKRNLIRLLFVIITILLLLKLNWTIKQNADLTVELDVLTIIRYIFASIESNVIFVVLYIVSIVVINKVYKIKYDENDLKKYEGYHRDIIAKYTPWYTNIY